jgi:uncharacterized protein YkwD
VVKLGWMFLLKFLLKIRTVDVGIFLLSLFLVSMMYLGYKSYRLGRYAPIVSPKITPTPTTITNTFSASVVEARIITPIPAPNPIIVTKSNNQIEWGKTVKIDDELSATYFAADDHMATADELNQAMNTYRLSHGLPTLTFDSLLCQIAEKRADQLVESGELSHAGFSDLAQNQNSFSSMAEVLFGSSQPATGIHIVEWGWDKSLTGHHEAISDPKWNEGCGATAGFYAVFIFGKR